MKAGNVMVRDWSTCTCRTCVMAVYRHYRAVGAEVAFVMMNPSDSPEQVLGLIERKKIEYPGLSCPEAAANSYGLEAFPIFRVVDRYGQSCSTKVASRG